MEKRKKIYDFIRDSDEWKKYNFQKKVIAILSSFVSLVSIILVILNFLILNNNILLITGLVILLINILLIIISTQIFIYIFRKGIYKNINKNINKIINIDREIIINDKIENYNYKKTMITMITDDVYDKIKKNMEI